MKVFQVLASFVFMALSFPVFADEVTPAMENAFLGKFKAAVTAKDYKAFRDLFYLSQNKGQWMDLQTRAPYETILSDSPRTYGLGPPCVAKDGWSALTIRPVYCENNWYENLHVVREIIITFSMELPDPYRKSHEEAVDRYGYPRNVAHIPLILKKGELWAVSEKLIFN